MTLPTRYQTELPLAGAPVEAGRARTVAGEFPLLAATLTAPVELGEFALDVSRVTLSDLRPGSAPGIGNIGAEVLKAFAVTVDSKNRRVRFER